VRKLLLGLMLAIGIGAVGQVIPQSEDVLGVHNLGAASSPVSGSNSNACLYCHAPHSGATKGPLWSQGFSSQAYSLYTSDTLQNTPTQPVIGKDSSLCLSCHDGTVAAGQVGASGPVKTQGSMTSVFGPKLDSSHPFSLVLPIKDSPNLVASLTTDKKTADTTNSVKLIGDNIECTTCHNGHSQRIDPVAPYFLARDNRNGGICLSCHATVARTVGGKNNPLDAWTGSAHATSAAQVGTSAKLGNYTTVAEFSCLSCHAPHNAGGAAGLLRNPTPAMTGVDTTSQSCYVCHDGSKALVQPIANVLAEFQKKGHPYADSTNLHTTTEPVVLNQNRHTTCADCHNSHSTKPVVTFGAAPDIRLSQVGISGAGTDGIALAASATKEYENCLRCHGASSGKQALSVFGYLPARVVTGGDPLNVISQFDFSAGSAHPVMRTAVGKQQTSLLKNMWDLTGTVPMRAMGTQIFCGDCHNSDDNREFGGKGPNGPHGSVNWHILERRYEYSQVATGTFPAGGPGSLVVNLLPGPLLAPSGGGPYSLCAKCHDLNNINSDKSFKEHSTHIQKGFSCSVCHSAHGVPGSGAAAMSAGDRLINFDANVVAPYNGQITWKNQHCALTCHMTNHDSTGKVTPVVVTPQTGAQTALPTQPKF
jgi:hypothetical protein